MTRREAAAVLLIPAAAQTVASPAQNPAQSPAEDLDAQARENIRRNREALARFRIDRSVEPATRFEA
jgi:hypothetical protein